MHLFQLRRFAKNFPSVTFVPNQKDRKGMLAIER